MAKELITSNHIFVMMQSAAGEEERREYGGWGLLHLQRTGAHHTLADPAAPPLHHGSATFSLPEARQCLH